MSTVAWQDTQVPAGSNGTSLVIQCGFKCPDCLTRFDVANSRDSVAALVERAGGKE